MKPARRLRLQDAVRSEFAFLADYGFAPHEESHTAVHYRSHCAALGIYHDRLSYELSLGLARLDNAQELAQPYGVGLLMALVDVDAARNYRYSVATSVQGVQRGVAQLAADLRAYGEAALRCDPDTFEALARASAAVAERMATESQNSRDETIASDAFEREDWARVIEVYEARGDELSPSQRKRLHLARRRMTESSPPHR